jgi:D-lactate dehydrogenase
MMNIVVFETETWAQTAWQRMKDDHEVSLLEEFLTSFNKGTFSIDGLMGFDLHGKTLAIIGTGVIGRHVGKIARGFGMEVVAFDVKQDEQWAAANGIRYTSFKKALSMADVITLHVPVTPDTHQLLADDQFAAMKEGAIIINTARGELVDVQELASGKIAAAGLDVLPEEQAFLEGIKNPATLFTGGQKLVTLLANHILLQHPNVCVTPHCAFFTREAVQRILDITMANIEAFVRGEPQNMVVPM